MPQPRTATAILEARGAFAKNPDRKRVDPVVTDPFPTQAPGHLNPLQVKCWHLIRECIPASVLNGADALMVEVCACLYAEFRSDSEGMATARIGQMTKLFGQFGMSPADRAKLATKPEDDDGAF